MEYGHAGRSLKAAAGGRDRVGAGESRGGQQSAGCDRARAALQVTAGDGQGVAELVDSEALYCWVRPSTMDILRRSHRDAGSASGSTVTATLLVTESPPLSVIVAVKVYVPAALNVTVVFLEAFVPLALNVGAAAPLGSELAAQVYFRLPSPASSQPKTDNCTAVPVTTLDATAAAVATVGGLLLIVTPAVPLTAPEVAVTVTAPASRQPSTSRQS